MFYSDRPINSGNEDKLNRKGFARLLARTLVNLDSKDTFTVGLFGKWGCGKTSLVNMTLEEIENIQAEDELKKEIIIVHFEPWNFTDTNQLLTQFFIRLANEFQKKGDKSLTKIGKALENYSDAFGLFELLPGVGAPIAAVGKWGFSRLGQKIQKGLDERDVLKQKNQVIQLLSAQSNRVLVVLDDIDRLNNEQIRYIFQLITSVARFPNMTYLLVFDKEIVVEALKDVQSGNGQDYLEKVIQMPIQIPNIQRSDLHNFLFEQLDKIIIDFKDLGYNQKHWQQLFQSCVDPFITHLRDINRLCNALRFKLTGISSEIDFADMLAISILEIQHPLVYNWAKNNKSILTGENDYSTLGVDKTQKEWLMHYTEIFYKLLSSERLNTSTEYETELVVRLLADLFPYFGQRVGKSYEIYDRNQLNRNNQIAHPDKFDRYFQLDIDSIAYKTADILNVIHNFDEHDIITLDELCTVETIFTNRVKEILKSNSLFDFPEWRMVYHLLNSFDPEYTKHYLESSLTQDTNILRFLRLFVTIWTGSGTEYEIQNGYDEYFSTERALSAIETCKKNRTILELPEELQHICAAFFLANSGNPECGNHIYQHATEKLISSWRM